ncbi:MAG TPA: GTP-binding protein [Phycisphaerae bacterium]|jgi:hydrogenase nickel incorporation protein HypB|nr:GTP-binding protein [Phycisphaerae bacterium]
MSTLHTHLPKVSTEPASPLLRAPVLAVGLVGPTGAGKTSLVEVTARQLRGKARLGVIIVNPAAERDADRVSRYCDHVEAVKAAKANLDVILPVLPKFDLANLDLLLMDVIAPLDGVPSFGQDATVAVLSVAAGDDKAPLYKDLLEEADALILNKADLQRHVMFDRGVFWGDVRRINADLDLIEVSTYENRGMDRWLAWLDRRRQEKHLHYFPDDHSQPETSFG